MLKIALFALIYLTIFILIEIFFRHLKLISESSRRITHLVSGLITIILPFFLNRNQIIILAILILVTLIISRKKALLKSIHGIKRASFGEFFYPIAVIAAALLFLPEKKAFFILSILIMAVSDTLANFFGSKFKSKILLFGKTLNGSVAFLVSSFIIGIFFLSIPQAVVLAIIATLVENISPLGSDNLTIIPACYLVLLLFHLM